MTMDYAPANDAPRPVSNLRSIEGARGAVPPANNLDAELLALSSLLLGEGEFDLAEVRARLLPEHFYAPAHRHIYEAILAVVDAGEPIELLTVRTQLVVVGRLADVGGSTYLQKILDFVPTVANLGTYIDKIVDAWALRETESIGARLVSATRRPVKDVGHFVDAARQAFEELGDKRGRAETPTDVMTTLRSYFQDRQEEAQNPTHDCPTGLVGLDRILGGGWVSKNYVVLGARPATGKTACGVMSLLSCAETPVEKGGGAALFVSAELDSPEINQRLLSVCANLSARQVRHLQHIERLTQAASWVGSLPIYIDDKARTLSTLRASVRRHHRLAAKKGLPLRLVVVDYLQRIKLDPSAPPATEAERIAAVSTEFQALSRAFKHTTFLVLAQLGRSATDRKDSRPTMNDLRGSGQIEMDADVIAILFHPDAKRRDRVTLAFEKNRGLSTDLALSLAIESETGAVSEVGPV